MTSFLIGAVLGLAVGSVLGLELGAWLLDDNHHDDTPGGAP